MQNKTYELRYLPLFYEDLLQKVTYIEEKLHNPKAASDLIDAVEKAIQDRVSCAESFEPYPSTISLNQRKRTSLLCNLCSEFCNLLCRNRSSDYGSSAIPV